MQELTPVRDVMRARRMISCVGEINEYSANNVCQQLLAMDFENPEQDIILKVSSFGGCLLSGFGICDTIGLIRPRVITLVVDKCMSAGSLIHLHGTHGLRVASPNAVVMVHQLSGGGQGSASEMKDAADEADRLQHILEDAYKKRSTMTKKKLKEIFSKDSMLPAPVALELGIIDRIVKNHKELYALTNH